MNNYDNYQLRWLFGWRDKGACVLYGVFITWLCLKAAACNITSHTLTFQVQTPFVCPQFYLEPFHTLPQKKLLITSNQGGTAVHAHQRHHYLLHSRSEFSNRHRSEQPLQHRATVGHVTQHRRSATQFNVVHRARAAFSLLITEIKKCGFPQTPLRHESRQVVWL